MSEGLIKKGVFIVMGHVKAVNKIALSRFGIILWWAISVRASAVKPIITVYRRCNASSTRSVHTLQNQNMVVLTNPALIFYIIIQRKIREAT